MIPLSPRKSTGRLVRSHPVSVIVPPRRQGALFVFEWAALAGIFFALLVILVPAYNNAASAGRATACAGNLQRLGEMAAMYATDYDGGYPPLPDADTLAGATQSTVAPEIAWMPRLAPYREKGDPKAKGKDNPFVCPAADADLPTYAYNAALGATVFPDYVPKSQPMTEAGILQPVQTLLFYDTANQDRKANNLAGCRFFYGGKGQGEYRPGDFVLPTQGVRETWVRPRHGDSVNALYCDGHVHRITDLSIRLARRNPFDPKADSPQAR